ncbi:hypothetical protein JOD43_001697 [Pullulanibacillus pueri]|uniref:DUF1189 domain-containing protein n=1 Tax=Pullulanibacillus pueri TaxID=1437324 RepID=A0A8J2ZUR4_9BACL|nr:DUF1189 family protein [Pullulanibacillus pueri]MBM7681530.1 hypothetical protein [Pullulanibacillus pueri]GGH79788.1 hypothetical protein GCM10007096_15240 [Pullulanibacillus pueri]
MKISLLKQLQKNLLHPKQASMFRFLKVGYNIYYAFFITLIAALLFSPSIISQSIDTTKDLSIIFIPLMLVLYYILLSAVVFFYISGLAVIALSIKSLLKKRLNYQHLWSLAANSITWPTLLVAVVNLFIPLPNVFIWLYAVCCLAMLTYLIYVVPKPKPRPTVPRKNNAVHKTDL